MHDIRLLRDAPDDFDAALARRGAEARAQDLLAIDAARRSAIAAAETAQAERNAASKMVGAAKARGDDAEFERLRALVAAKKDEGARLEAEAKAADEALTAELMALPNAPLPDTPDGPDESANVELRRWGTPRAFDFAPREHFEIGEAMGGMDFDAAAKLSGARFVVLNGALNRLHRALGQFMLDTHVDENGLTEVWTPVLVNGKSISDTAIRETPLGGTGQLPKFREDLYYAGSEGWRDKIFESVVDNHLDFDQFKSKEDLKEAFKKAFESAPTTEEFWLIPTAEVTLTNLVAGQILDGAVLPRRYTALSQCFRSEAGSAGKDTRGMLRQHQFEKVEMVSITRPEDGRAELERMTACAEGILQKLEIPYRTIVLCTGDMGFSAQRTHDIEAWLPGQNAYREISSCSLCGDFQARRMNARFRRGEGEKPEFVHTLNGSGLAVGRCMIAVIENFQQADGSVTIPGVLRPYMKGATRIAPDGSLA